MISPSVWDRAARRKRWLVQRTSFVLFIVTATTLSITVVVQLLNANQGLDRYRGQRLWHGSGSPSDTRQFPFKLRPVTVNRVVAAGGLSDLRDDDLVLGARVGTEARAYPINSLSGPFSAVVNDVLGEEDIVVTW